MAVERAERRSPLDPEPNLTVIPGGRAERPAPAVTTFEQEVLINAGINSFQKIPKKDFIVVMAVLAMDALNFSTDIAPKEKRHILGYYLFTAAEGEYTYIREYMNEGNDRKAVADVGPRQIHKSVDQKIDHLLNPLWESESLIKGYNEFARFIKLVDRVMPSFRYDADKRKIVTSEVATLHKEGFDDEEIPGFFDLLRKVLPRDAWGTMREGVVREVVQQTGEALSDEGIIADKKGIQERALKQSLRVVSQIEKPKTEEEKFFSAHPEAYTVLELKNLKIKHEEIAERLGKTIWEVQELVKGLNFFGKTQPYPASAARVAKEAVFLRQVIDLRNNNKDNKEITEELKVPVDRVYNGASLLIWMGLIEPLDKKEVRAKIIDKKVFYLDQLSRYLESHPFDGISSIKMLYEAFCVLLPEAKISYRTFVGYYHEVEVTKQVPPSRLTYRQRVRRQIVDEISRIRATEGNVITKVGDICARLSIPAGFGANVFNSIEDTGPSNTNKWRKWGRLRFTEIVKEIAFSGGEVNVSQICEEIGITSSFGLQVYHDLQKEINLPPLKVYKQRKVQAAIFEASPA